MQRRSDIALLADRDTRRTLRRARRTGDRHWHMVEDSGGVSRILPLDWRPDGEGHWPRVELECRGFGARIACPGCGTEWTLQETDAVFGTARREGNDVLLLVRCASCRLPHAVRGLGFATAFPAVVELMGGWLAWERRAAEFEAEEARLYGQ